MAVFETAIEHTLAEEGGFYHNPTTGEYAMYGITHWTLRDIGLLPHAERNVPASPDDINFVKSLPLSTAKGIYWAHFWKPLRLDDLNDQPVAGKVFDLQVNTGQGALILQQAVNVFLDGNAKINMDNICGSITIRAANACPPVELLHEVRVMAEAHYRAIAAADPRHAGDLKGWLARLARG